MTFEEVRDALLSHFQEEWASKAPDIMGRPDAPPVWHENLEEDGEPPGDTYAKVVLVDVFGADAVLGATLFDRVAILTIQVHTPGGGGMTSNDRLAQMVVERFRGQRLCSICLRRVRRITVGATGSTYQTNVLVDVEYTDRK